MPRENKLSKNGRVWEKPLSPTLIGLAVIPEPDVENESLKTREEKIEVTFR